MTRFTLFYCPNNDINPFDGEVFESDAESHEAVLKEFVTRFPKDVRGEMKADFKPTPDFLGKTVEGREAFSGNASVTIWCEKT